DDRWDGGCEQADVVVLDTWDEMWRPTTAPLSDAQRAADARWLRERARACGTALVLTARLPRRTSPASPVASAHPAYRAIADGASQRRPASRRRAVAPRARQGLRHGAGAHSAPAAVDQPGIARRVGAPRVRRARRRRRRAPRAGRRRRRRRPAPAHGPGARG